VKRPWFRRKRALHRERQVFQRTGDVIEAVLCAGRGEYDITRFQGDRFVVLGDQPATAAQDDVKWTGSSASLLVSRRSSTPGIESRCRVMWYRSETTMHGIVSTKTAGPLTSSVEYLNPTGSAWSDPAALATNRDGSSAP
jgi:hypothetical protein